MNIKNKFSTDKKSAIIFIIAYLSFNVINYLHSRLNTILDYGLSRTYSFKYAIALFLLHGFYSCLLGVFIVLTTKIKHRHSKNIPLTTLIMWLQPVVMIITPLLYFCAGFNIPRWIVMNMNSIFKVGFLLLGVNIADCIKVRKS